MNIYLKVTRNIQSLHNLVVLVFLKERCVEDLEWSRKERVGF